MSLRRSSEHWRGNPIRTLRQHRTKSVCGSQRVSCASLSSSENGKYVQYSRVFGTKELAQNLSLRFLGELCVKQMLYLFEKMR